MIIVNKIKQILLCTILSFSLIGCGEININIEPNIKPVIKEEPEVENVEEEIKTENNEIKNETNQTIVEVSTVEELINAIAPNRHIIVKPGYYNISKYLDKIWTSEGNNWNNEHKYVNIRECFDGLELFVQYTDNLTIAGELNKTSETEIVTEPRYASVLSFLNCNNLKLMYITSGHTDYGECSGNVINLIGCQNINIKHCDFYGCGVYGIATNNGTGKLKVVDTTIRECMYGPIDLTDCFGDIEFRNCTLINSDGGGYYDYNNVSTLSFYDCTFGEKETAFWTYYQGITTENCNWADLSQVDYEYPDYSGVSEDVGMCINCINGRECINNPTCLEKLNIMFNDLPDEHEYENVDVDFEILNPIPFDANMLTRTLWIGGNMIDQISDEKIYLPIFISSVDSLQVFIKFEDDGTGTVEYLGNSMKCKWELNSDYLASIKLEDGRIMNVTLHQEGKDGLIWLQTYLNDKEIWLY